MNLETLNVRVTDTGVLLELQLFAFFFELLLNNFTDVFGILILFCLSNNKPSFWEYLVAKKKL